MDGNVTIDGSGVNVEYPNATIPYITNLGYGVKVSKKNSSSEYAEITPSQIIVTSGTGNYTQITKDNVKIFVNSAMVWSAR